MGTIDIEAVLHVLEKHRNNRDSLVGTLGMTAGGKRHGRNPPPRRSVSAGTLPRL